MSTYIDGFRFHIYNTEHLDISLDRFQKPTLVHYDVCFG